MPFHPEALAASLPPLVVAAERVAATVAQGLHGRRRVGVGENFWQFRPFVTGDSLARVDWRRSGRSDQVYVRETEWDAAQTVALWHDAAATGMRWRSVDSLPTKAERAALLLLALASLLLRGGERVRLLEGPHGNATGFTAGRLAMSRLADALTECGPGLPRALPPAHGRVVLFGDWLEPIEPLAHLLGQLAALPAGGVVVQILDPAEIELPFRGRIRFAAPDDARRLLVPKVEAIRPAYRDKLRQRQADLARLCGHARLALIVHRTDAPPQQALLSLYHALSGLA